MAMSRAGMANCLFEYGIFTVIGYGVVRRKPVPMTRKFKDFLP